MDNKKGWVLKVVSAGEITLADLLFSSTEVREAVEEVFEGLGLDVHYREQQCQWLANKLNTVLLSKVEEKIVGEA